jgi:uncharacterized protein (TIGR02452 family)
MNVKLIQTARETMAITKAGRYSWKGEERVLPEGDFRAVEVVSPECGAELLGRDFSGAFQGEMCRIEVTEEDSFLAAARIERPLVLNFANAHHPGGGFLIGARAQEEALCRASTLYASISSEKAREMYRYNNTHPGAVESDYMLLSPEVCVFRDIGCEPLERPFRTAVLTAPAPNRRGAALFASEARIRETFLRRIRIILRVAVDRGYRNLVLGAWGCGAFGNDPGMVAECFRTALAGDGFGRAFDTVVFAVYGKPDGPNLQAFRGVFGSVSEKP